MHRVLAAIILHNSCRWRSLSRLQELRLPRSMCSHGAAALTQQLHFRRTIAWFKRTVHDPCSQTTATNDDQNSKHSQYTTKRYNKFWFHLPLTIPRFLLRRAAVAGHIRSLVQASFSGATDICRNARRVANDYRGWAARRHSIKIQ